MEAEADRVLEQLLELDARGRAESLHELVERKLAHWEPTVLIGIATAEWAAGDKTESCAAEEEARGAPGLGSMPPDMAQGLAELGSYLTPPPAPAVHADWQNPGRSEHVMERWEALQRVSELVYRRLALKWSRGECQGQLGEPVAALLAGRAGEGSDRAETWISALALAERLLDRGLGWSEPLVSLMQQDWTLVPRRQRAGSRAWAGQVLALAGNGGTAAQVLAGAEQEPSSPRWKLLAKVALGDLHAGRGDFRQACAFFADAAGHAWRLRCRRLCHHALLKAAWCLLTLGSAQTARALLETTGSAAEEMGDALGQALACAYLGILHEETGVPETARRNYERALTIYRRLKSLNGQGRVLGNLGRLDHSTGAPLRALESYESAIEIHRRVGNRGAEGIVLGNLATLHMQTGAPDRARALYESAQAVHREVGSRNGEATVLGNLGILNAETGAPEKARSFYQSALRIHQELGNRRFVGTILGNLANLHMQMGCLEQALEVYEEALLVHRETGNRRAEGGILGNLGILHMETGAFRLAGEHFTAALTIYEEAGARREQGFFRECLASLYLDLGQEDRALAHAQAACAMLSELGDLESLQKTWHTLARCQMRRSADREARTAFRSCVDTLERWLRGIGSDDRRSRLIEEALPIFQEAVAFLLREQQPAPEDLEQAFEIAERAMSRCLLERIRCRDQRRSLPVEFAQERRALEIRLCALQDALLRERSGAEPRQGALEYITQELDGVRQQHTELLEELALRFPAYAAHEGFTPPITIAEAQARIVVDRHRALLKYFITRDETFLWILCRDRVRLLRLGLGEAELEQRIEKALRPLRNFCQTKNVARLLPLLPDRLHELMCTLLEPALAHLEEIEELLIVPTGAIYEVPFEMLVLQPPDPQRDAAATDHFSRSKFLVERFHVAYGPSATLLDPQLVPEPEPPQGSAPQSASERGALEPLGRFQVLALGDPQYEAAQTQLSGSGLSGSATISNSFTPLPGTRREVQTLERLFGEVRALLHSEARESAYRRHAPSADLVHFGCHGVIDGNEPAYSGIVLSPGEQPDEDAFLQAFEIARTRFERRPLVVISACEVAGGKLSAAEGLLGLTRAFAEAGAGSVVASAWPVDDAFTARLMSQFYEALAAGETPIAALGKAKRAVLTLARTTVPATDSSQRQLLPAAHPYHWAGFCIHGVAATLPLQSRGA